MLHHGPMVPSTHLREQQSRVQDWGCAHSTHACAELITSFGSANLHTRLRHASFAARHQRGRSVRPPPISKIWLLDSHCVLDSSVSCAPARGQLRRSAPARPPRVTACTPPRRPAALPPSSPSRPARRARRSGTAVYGRFQQAPPDKSNLHNVSRACSAAAVQTLLAVRGSADIFDSF